MRKVIDLCLDMPMGAEALTNMLSAMCLDPLYRGYKKTYGAGVAAQVGLTVEEIDAIYESEGRDGFCGSSARRRRSTRLNLRNLSGILTRSAWMGNHLRRRSRQPQDG